ncbi:MAG TPA: transposase [Ktedonobacteraceae bacterium]|nr:transposase [Ktedonobacteraceae bacterium]
MDRDLLQSLLHATVQALRAEIPGLGETVAFDVKHIYGWVRENNPRVYVKGRFDVTHIPTGDPDCRLGVKKSSNQVQPDGSTKEKKESLFGYGSGVAAATNPVYGDVVLAEYTQPFNEGDVTYFRPLYRQSVLALDLYPTNVTADAAFDAWYVYHCAALHGGMGAVPLNQHAHRVYERDADGTPRCPKGLRMQATFHFQHTNGYRAHRFRCPLLFPQTTGDTCDHAQFAKGCGCVKDVNAELGGQMRVTLDRQGPQYRAIYNQRTSCERINSQAQALGIERPKVRNGHSVATLNTLIYLVINARALAKVQSINKGILPMN